jgi:antiphage defense system Thoeris ThsB-like protein
MSRRVYFAFHYQPDITRVNVVRNSWVTKDDREAAGFYDHSLWEESQNKGDEALKRMINGGLKGTTVTAFLLGARTAYRPWVRYELEKSWQQGNGLLAVYIHEIKDFDRNTTTQGDNILDLFTAERGGSKVKLSSIYRTYDWKSDDGYENFGVWVERAAKIAASL